MRGYPEAKHLYCHLQLLLSYPVSLDRRLLLIMAICITFGLEGKLGEEKPNRYHALWHSIPTVDLRSMKLIDARVHLAAPGL